MIILPQFDLGTIRKAILDDVPDLKIETVDLIDSGWDNVAVEINHEWIFRFPKDNEVPFDTEVTILNRLKDKITLPIPRIEFLGQSSTYMGYRKIPGGNLTEELFDTMNRAEKDKLVFDLSNFLIEIHSAISIDEARDLGVRDEDLFSYSNMIRSNLVDRICDTSVGAFVREMLSEFEAMIPETTELVFLYNDLHTDNMAFDAENKRLNGIFDFGDVCVGDINMDFYPLYKFDRHFMKAVAEKYQQLTGRQLDLRRIVIYGRIAEMCDLAEYIDKPESTVYHNALARINRWKTEAIDF